MEAREQGVGGDTNNLFCIEVQPARLCPLSLLWRSHLQEEDTEEALPYQEGCFLLVILLSHHVPLQLNVCSVAESLATKYWHQCRSGRLFPQRFTLKEGGPHAGVALSHSTHKRRYACSAHFLGKLRSANFATKTGTKAPDIIKHQSQEQNSTWIHLTHLDPPATYHTLWCLPSPTTHPVLLSVKCCAPTSPLCCLDENQPVKAMHWNN